MQTIIQHNNKFYTLGEEVNVILQQSTSSVSYSTGQVTPPKIKIQQQAMRKRFTSSTDFFDKCDKLIGDFAIYTIDPHGDYCTTFPTVGLSFRHEYLRVGNMEKGEYNEGANDYKEYSGDQLINTMPSTEKRNCIFKNTIDTKKPAFTKALDDDCYAKGYTRQTKSQIDKILTALAGKLGLTYNSTTTSDQPVVKAYMYLKGALGWEWMNTDWNTGKDGDAYGHIDDTSISDRAILCCYFGSRRISRVSHGTSDCSVALVKEI